MLEDKFYCNNELTASFNKVNSRTHIEQLIELFGNKDNIFQLQNESKTPIFSQVSLAFAG